MYFCSMIVAMKNQIITLFLVITSCCGMYGQEFLEVTFQSNLSQTLVQLLFNSVGIDVVPTTGVNTYKVTYTTLGTDMNIDTASGLMMLPDNIEGPMPLAIYQHATTSGRSDVPSNLQGTYELGAALTSLGMAVCAPDYLGMGESRGFHPYLYGRTEGQAAVDMLQAMEQYLSNEELEYTSDLFIFGYSQGGQATMAAHRLIEEEYSDQYQVTASLPMSGPYDLSELLGESRYSDTEYLYPGYLVYNTLGLRAIDPSLFSDVSELFKEEYLPAIRAFEESGENLFNGLNLSIVEEMQLIQGEVKPRFMFLDSILNVFENEPSHPLNEILKDSDYFNWAPKAPLRMTYCPDDDQVDYRNATKADSVMNLMGAVDVDAIDVSDGQVLNHTGCIVPSLNFGIPWLLSFLDNTVSTEEELLSSVAVNVYPNPASQVLNIDIQDGEIEHADLYRIDGIRLGFVGTYTSQKSINISQIASGIYLLDIYTTEGRATKKIAIQR